MHQGEKASTMSFPINHTYRENEIKHFIARGNIHLKTIRQFFDLQLQYDRSLVGTVTNIIESGGISH